MTKFLCYHELFFRPYIFALFAWAFLLGVKPFLLDTWERVMVHTEVKDGLFKSVEQTLSGAELEKLYGSRRSLAVISKLGSGKWELTEYKEMVNDSEEGTMNDSEDVIRWMCIIIEFII
jgi:hypothetical protein